jgi:hypothetical protein
VRSALLVFKSRSNQLFVDLSSLVISDFFVSRWQSASITAFSSAGWLVAQYYEAFSLFHYRPETRL